MPPRFLLYLLVLAVSASMAQPGDNIACTICKGALTLVDDVITGNATEDEGLSQSGVHGSRSAVDKIAVKFCELNGGGLGYKCHGEWQCMDMCTHAVAIFEPEIFEIGSLKFFDPETDCVRFGYCTPSAAPTTPRRSTKSEPKVKARLPNPQSAKTSKDTGVLRIVQVTDIHMVRSCP